VKISDRRTDSCLIAVGSPSKSTGWEINQRIQEWRGAGARGLGILRALTQLVTPTRSNTGLDEGHQIDFIENFESPDLPPHVFHFSEGDPWTR
jgi:hypothetical protein